jgi:hypothetical protein
MYTTAVEASNRTRIPPTSYIQVGWYTQSDSIETCEAVVLPQEVVDPIQEVLQHSELQCVQNVRFWQVRRGADEPPQCALHVFDAPFR